MSALSDALNDANVNQWSAREISRRLDGRLSHSVVAKYLGGRHARHPKDYVLDEFATVFPSLTVQQLRELAGYSPGESTPYEPPGEANRLDARERRAVDELIMLLARKKEGGDAGGDTTATNGPRLVRAPGTGPFESSSQVSQAARAVKDPSVGQRARAAQDDDAEGSQDPDD